METVDLVAGPRQGSLIGNTAMPLPRRRLAAPAGFPDQADKLMPEQPGPADQCGQGQNPQKSERQSPELHRVPSRKVARAAYREPPAPVRLSNNTTRSEVKLTGSSVVESSV